MRSSAKARERHPDSNAFRENLRTIRNIRKVKPSSPDKQL